VRLSYRRRMSSTVAWKEPARTITEPRSAKRSELRNFSAEPFSGFSANNRTRHMRRGYSEGGSRWYLGFTLSIESKLWREAPH